MTVAQWIVTLAIIYIVMGLAFALAVVIFSAGGIGRIDPAAKDSPVGFRLLILPGVAAFWPLLLKRWWNGRAHPPGESNPHRKAVQEVKQ